MATRTYERSSGGTTADDTPHAHLFVVLNCAAPLDGATRHRLDDVDDVHLGRAPRRSAQRTVEAGRAVLRIAIADDRISTAHARITRSADGFVFEDPSSKNGSFVNGTATRRAILEDGDLIQIGQTLLLFRAAIPTPPSAAFDVEQSARASAFATLVPSLARDFDALAAMAKADIPILLISETGTGKEVIARAIHALSKPSGAFVAVNCGALTTTLAESILFGHKRGAFSGATTDQLGLLRTADGGTLLLDEIGDMPLALQPTLLRALQEGEVVPVGATTPVRIRTRFVAATHRDLETQIEAGTFREDLFARIAGFVFRLPPLRDRREDIGLLTSALLRRIGEGSSRTPSISPEAGALLLRYAWPRNVRELEKCLTRAALLAGDAPIAPSHLPPELRPKTTTESLATESRAPAKAKEANHRDAITRDRIVALLVAHQGNLAAVADALHTSRSQVHRWLRRFDIDVSTYRSS